ncbi:MAG TPA: RNA 2',3'-cyclic phosphodiesterase [Solirubrobacteraceae bacterium]|nr:RNA 2',3'-cyclic phosphodiesterase [Solirubrobacteraceae bacterium]
MRRRDRRDRERGGGHAPGEAATGSIRSFVAVLLPEDLRQRVDAAAAPLRERAAALGVRVSWGRAETFHLTLRFLGAIDEARVERVREAMAEAAAATAPFTVGLGGFGGFPSARSPRVVWLGLTAGDEALAGLHARLEQALAARGIPPEGRAFHGHLTLGRARDLRGAPELAALVSAPAPPLGEARVDAVHLMRSELAPTGARHSVLARAPLGGAPRGAARLT